MSRTRVRAAMTGIAAVWMMAGCSDADHAARDHHAARDYPAPGVDTGRTDSGLAAAARTANLEPGALKTVPSAPVHRGTGPGDQPFEVALHRGARDGPQGRVAVGRERRQVDAVELEAPARPDGQRGRPAAPIRRIRPIVRGRGRDRHHHHRTGQPAVMISGSFSVTSTVSSMRTVPMPARFT